MGARIPDWAFFKASSLFTSTLTPKPRDRLGYTLDCDDFEPVDILLRQVRFGNDRTGEAQLGCFLQALLTARRGAHFAREPYFAEHRELARQRLVDVRGNDSEQHREVGGGLADTHAANGVHEHVLVVAGDPGMAMQHREQHREAVLLETHRQPARIGGVRGIDQGLDLHQQRARAFLGHEHARSCDLLGMLRQENRRRIGNPAQSLVGHREHAQLVHRAEAVLEGADKPEALVRIAFEVEHGVDDVLPYARTRDRALLGDVADEHHDRPARLGVTRQVRHALAHLRDRAGSGGELLRVERLDRVDDGDFRLGFFQGREDALELDLGEQLELPRVEREAPRAQRHLLGGFLAAYVYSLVRAAYPGERLEKKRGFPHAGVAPDQHHLARDEAAAEHAVELVHAARHPRRVARAYVGEPLELGALRDARKTVPGRRLGEPFDQRVPGAALRALSLPLRRLAAAFGAGEDARRLAHQSVSETGTRAASPHRSS